ncbi:mycothiol-dependent nitroreductase Rv2466c family protein [Pseudonocardia parietis]|uniref:Uncharacterized protein n=1 Tax=Pseudonocardia parietis TaxID=570936 RepID=A0ABS4VLL8_9PSEU|nr:hypothetical protein [Pseudonocardia parietis]MBP2364814.1 hypothetical protein [Pseudonocardia parietis]
MRHEFDVDTVPGWTVDFWLDPACPLTRHTARWVVRIAEEVPLQVRWRVMSLSVLNEHRDDDPEDDPHGYLWIPARVAAAVQTEDGHTALGRFYDALWTEPDGTEREWIGDIDAALQVPDAQDPLQLWHALTGLMSVPAFHEIKA